MSISHPVATIGPYRLLGQIGEGGMGVVHLAAGQDGRQVAIKLLRPHIVGDTHGRARMAREVTSLRRVRSIRVAEVYDADPWGDTPYVVTRYVPGLSLHDRVHQHGPIRGDELTRVAQGLAEALVAVHRVDVLHRDVKPSNVLLDGSGPVLIDFGLAQLADDSRLTHSGWLLGTPGYLAPEILYGDEPTAAADVHSWSATVVFAATGEGPYGKGPAVAVMDRVRRGEHDLSGVPDSLRWIISRALLPDPADRPSSTQLVQWTAGSVAAVGGPHQPARREPATQILGQDLPRTAAGPAGIAEVWAPAAPRAWPEPAAGSEREAALRSASRAGVEPSHWPDQPYPQPNQSVQPNQPDQPNQRDQPDQPDRPDQPDQPRRANRAAAFGFWSAVLAGVAAGAVTAPVVTAATIAVLGWLLRTVAVRGRVRESWWRRRGPRRGDGLLAALCIPWFTVVALPAAIITAGISVAVGILVVLVGSWALADHHLESTLALGGVAAAVCIWSGPFSADLRVGARRVSAGLLKPGRPTMVALVVVVAAVAAILALRLVGGAHYEPAPAPPWGHAIANLLP